MDKTNTATAQQAIDKCILHDEVIWIAYDAQVAADLRALASRTTTVGGHVEFCGIDKHDNEWTVLMNVEGAR